MGKKLIKKKQVVPVQELEEVTEDQAIEIVYDEDTNELVIINHYRTVWGDGIDADMEQCMNIEQSKSYIGALLDILKSQQERALQMAGVQIIGEMPKIEEKKHE